MDVYFYLAKYLPLLLMPLTVVLLLLLVGILLAGKHMRLFSRIILIVALLTLWAASTPLVAESLYGKLESVHRPVSEANIPEAECMVLLGGAVSAPLSPRVDTEIRETSDRAVKAASLLKAGKARQVIISAGNKPLTEFDESTTTEAHQLRTLLMEWGVPESAIVLERGSRTTWENASNTKPLIQQLGCGMPLLVTSAAHMPRAVRAFNVLGINVIPIAVDVRVVDVERPILQSLLPRAEALVMTSDGIREWLGRVIYRLRGWN